MAYSISYYYDPDDFEIKIEEVDTLSEKAEIQKNIRFSTISAQLLPDPDWCNSFMGKRSSRRRRLICRNGYYLAVHPNGTVKGTLCKNDPYSKYIATADNNVFIYTIIGVYICIVFSCGDYCVWFKFTACVYYVIALTIIRHGILRI